MPHRPLAAAFALVAVLAAPPAAADDALPPAPDEATKRAFEPLIRQYILDHPEVILESLQAYRARQEQAEREAVKSRIAALDNDLARHPSSPVAGNPDGGVTIVEFFDYRCGFCKRVFPEIVELLRTDPDVRYVFKELPVLGPESEFAARASLAAWFTEPEKYLAFHTALMGARGLGERRVLELAAHVGLDPEGLRAAMRDPRVDDELRRNREIASMLRVAGTPAFVIAGQLVPGAIDIATMRALIEEARRG